MPQVSLLHGMLLLLSGILAGSRSPALAGRAGVEDRSEQEQPGTLLVTECPTCALLRLGSVGPPDMVEAVKRHILNMLRLEERPNVTQPIPRAALLNAIKKLHVGRVGQDGTVELEDELRNQAEMQELAEQTSEVITFSQAGGAPDIIGFQISGEGGELSLVEQASVWLFLKLSKNNRSRAKVTIRLLQQRVGSSVAEATVADKVVDTRRSGWHTFPVSESVQALLTQGGGALTLRAACEKCAEVGAMLLLTGSSERAQSHRPFLVAVVRQVGDRSHQRRKRGLECDGKIRICCKKQFYVNFKDIGWNDWIIAPPGYHANYCEGDCPSHVAAITGSSLSFHSTVINHYRMRGYSPFTNIKSCCVPTRLRAMSMLYYNEEQKIVKKDIQNMIVEECGCS